MLKLAPEGYPFIAAFGTLSVVVFFLFGPLYAAITIPAVLFMLWFFRDPDRDIPQEKDVFVSPADGRIIVARESREDRYLQAEVQQVSIFMSPLNVHVNRVPCDGEVKTVRHNKGRFFAAYKDEASFSNENIEMVFGTRYGDLLLRQVAGFVARRAVCRVSEGTKLVRGERYGMIKFSSRVDIYLPKDAIIRVGLDQTVKAGETVIAEYRRG